MKIEILTDFIVDCRTSNVTHGYSDVVKNSKCNFPFQYKGKKYTECTEEYSCKDCFWCGTQLNVTEVSGWGFCSDQCEKEDGNIANTLHSEYFLITEN